MEFRSQLDSPNLLIFYVPGNKVEMFKYLHILNPKLGSSKRMWVVMDSTLERIEEDGKQFKTPLEIFLDRFLVVFALCCFQVINQTHFYYRFEETGLQISIILSKTSTSKNSRGWYYYPQCKRYKLLIKWLFAEYISPLLEVRLVDGEISKQEHNRISRFSY
ncbi:hypothetical protein RF11_06163 [Thelohanellus kitauei]|uniref:Uncharacterized protein n=1 Tax=Thelohanellus kitauei TaxID=669202 RepID=A0A0C2JRI7_THEKT|nr:hypothetical protein RF11_06163 [Thelohanellus kitauei]